MSKNDEPENKGRRRLTINEKKGGRISCVVNVLWIFCSGFKYWYIRQKSLTYRPSWISFCILTAGVRQIEIVFVMLFGGF